MDDAEQPSLIEQTSAFPFQQTVARIAAAIQTAGLNVFARIDHAAAAREVGLNMPPTLVLIYGSPSGGTPVMLAAPQAALDLPLRVMIREDEAGTTVIAFHPVVEILRRAGVSPEIAKQLEPAQALLVKAVEA
jgi:uncharacterized protein (DUF302 family)